MDCNQETKNMQIPPSEIRDAFAKAMSKMFAKEVPMYSKLTALVDHVNKKTLQADETLRSSLQATDDLDRISCERHGAIRLGTAKELATIKRILSIMGMFPTGYYDLSAAGIPVHATCFRPHDATELSKNPFRLFVSLLRPELIESDALRARVVSIISRRQIFNAQILQLLKTFDKNGGVNHSESEELVKEAVNIFQWKNEASIAKADYEKLMEEGAVLADIVAFPNPHINHLTPRTLDIDSVQSTMQEWGIPFKDCIEGPPKRKCPIVLRQTSFKAVEEDVSFPAAEFLSNDTTEPLSDRRGYHTARFGEIEQRGAALTRKGRSYYDHLLRLALEKEVTALDTNAFTAIFSKFPDTWDELRLQGLVWFKYYVPAIITHDRPPNLGTFSLNKLVNAGWIKYEPIIYEDFLPISAAGIFRSNISGQGKSSRPVRTYLNINSKGLFEEALGSNVSDEFEIYENIEKESITRCRELYERDRVTR